LNIGGFVSDQFDNAEFTLAECFGVGEAFFVFGFGAGVGCVGLLFGGGAAHDDFDVLILIECCCFCARDIMKFAFAAVSRDYCWLEK